MTENKKLTALFVAVNAKYVHTNIAVRYLANACKERGFLCDFCEFTINEPRGRIVERLYMWETDIYGFSCYIWNIGHVLELCRDLKVLKPDCKIILGGPEVSFGAEELLCENSFIDYIVCGEGEKAIPKLLESMPKQRCIIHGELSELDELPFPYADADLANVVSGEKLVYYETSRGCPFRCAYCLSSVAGRVRFLSLERIKTEIERFVKAGVMTVKFVDRTFNADKKRALEIWKFCSSLDGETRFHFEIGADLIDAEAIEFLKTVPKDRFQFEIGVQSTNLQTLDAVSRKTDLEKLKANVRELRSAGNIHLHLDLIAGLPYEDYSSFANSFNEIYGLRPHALQLGFLKLLKGSGLRSDAGKFGILYSETAPYEVFSTNQLDYGEIIRLKAIEDVFERYYNSGRFENVLPVVEKGFETPFGFYEVLADFWSRHGLVGQGVKRITLYNLLYEFMCENSQCVDIKSAVKEMKKDFSMWHSNGIGTPQWYKETI